VNLTNLKNAEFEFNFIQNKVDRLAEFEKALPLLIKEYDKKHFATLKHFRNFCITCL